MTRLEKYGKTWEIVEGLGQEGLLNENHYRKLFTPRYLPTSLTKDDVWLDVGANIGAFCVRAAEHVAAVIAVEPEPDCLQLLETNLRLNNISNVEIIDAAVVGDDSPTVMLALSNTFSSTHRVGNIRGRDLIEVRAENIDILVYEHNVNKIKMDCEGSEVGILENMDLTPIDEIIFEYHFSFIKDRPWTRYFNIIQRLEDNGMSILRGIQEQSKTWHTIVWMKRL